MSHLPEQTTVSPPRLGRVLWLGLLLLSGLSVGVCLNQWSSSAEGSAHLDDGRSLQLSVPSDTPRWWQRLGNEPPNDSLDDNKPPAALSAGVNAVAIEDRVARPTALAHQTFIGLANNTHAPRGPPLV